MIIDGTCSSICVKLMAATQPIVSLAGANMRVLSSTLAACVIPMLFWLGGYNFDVHGVDAVVCAVMSIITFISAYTFPRN